MPRCEITGKGPMVKNLVSHSNIKTKKVVQPNVQRKRFYSAALGATVILRVATSTIRSIDHAGGLDQYLLRQDPSNMSKHARHVQARIRKRLAG